MAAGALDSYLADRDAGRDALLICDTWEMADARAVFTTKCAMESGATDSALLTNLPRPVPENGARSCFADAGSPSRPEAGSRVATGALESRPSRPPS